MPETQPAPVASTRIKRNTACTSCRDAKVRCNPSQHPGEQCQRCTKLNLQCVVDKTHRRISRKSKIDELVQEIQSIKQSVGDRSAQLAPQTPHSAVPFKDNRQPLLGMQSPAISSRPNVALGVMQPAISTGQTPATTALLAPDHGVEPSLPRALGSRPFSGEHIDYYFQMYFEHFHPYMPIIRHRDPNKCYETGNVLFWTIIMVSCRRYARSPTALQFLMDAVRRELFSAISSLPLSIHTINALILVCTWVFPDIRFVYDPTSLFAGSITNAALLLGLHLGKGSHPEYSLGAFQNNFSDEEAHYTWAGYNITTQRVSAYMGLPPTGGLFNQTVQNVIDGNTPFQVPSSFRVLLECQKFANRVSKTMAACLEETRGVSSHVVRQIEDEFDNIRGLICSERADDLDRFNALLVLLEIQTYYLIPLPGYDPKSLKHNVLRTYTTAQTVVKVSLELDRSHDFLKHMPHFYFRSLLCASCIIYKVLRSSYMDFLDRKQAEQAASDVISACRRSVIQEGDLPTRLGNLLESIYHVGELSLWHEEPISEFSHRLGASVNFDCLRRWKEDMASSHSHKSQPPPADGNEAATAVPGQDPFANIDWGFMDDFDWNIEPALLAPGIMSN